MRSAWAWLIAVALLASARGASGAPPSLGAVEGDIREILAEKDYAFCHDQEQHLYESERLWCPLVGDESRVCPAFPTSCPCDPDAPKGSASSCDDPQGKSGSGSSASGRGVPTAKDPDDPSQGGPMRDIKPRKKREGEDGADSASGGRGRSREGSGPKPREPDKADEPKVEVPSAIGGIARFFFFLLLAAFVGFVAWMILKNVRRGGDEGADESPDEPEKTAGAEPRAPGPVETDVSRLLARARAAAARGDFAGAIQDTYAALLRRLEGDGLIDLHPSRTNGDYVRALRERPDLRDPVRQVFSDVERVQFGTEHPTGDRFESIYQRVLPLVARAMAFALLALGLSAGFACSEKSRPTSTRGSSFETTPLGSRALVDVLRRRDKNVEYRRASLDTTLGERTLVLLPGTELDDAACKRLLGWVRQDGGILIVAGVDDLGPSTKVVEGKTTKLGCDFAREVGIGLTETIDPGLVEGPAMGADYTPYEIQIPAGPTFDAEPRNGRVLLRRAFQPYAIERVYGYGEEQGRLVLFADDQLFTNVSLIVGHNARFMAGLFDYLPERDIEFCDAWSGAGADTPLDAIREAHLTPIILQLLAVFALYFLFKGVAFGTPRDPTLGSRRAFSDHVRALGGAYARARASRHALGLYSAWVLERLRDRFGRSRRGGLHTLAEGIAARTGRPEGEVMGILVEATGARDEVAPPSSYHGDGSARANAGYPWRPPNGEQSDVALMNELESFLDATRGGPARR